MEGIRRPINVRSSAAIAMPPTADQAGSRACGRVAAMTAAQPTEIAR
jgi:hypothetical protein